MPAAAWHEADCYAPLRPKFAMILRKTATPGGVTTIKGQTNRSRGAQKERKPKQKGLQPPRTNAAKSALALA